MNSTLNEPFAVGLADGTIFQIIDGVFNFRRDGAPYETESAPMQYTVKVQDWILTVTDDETDQVVFQGMVAWISGPQTRSTPARLRTS